MEMDRRFDVSPGWRSGVDPRGTAQALGEAENSIEKIGLRFREHLAGKPRFFERSENHGQCDDAGFAPEFSEGNNGSSFLSEVGPWVLLLGSWLADAPIRLGAHLTPSPDLEPSIPSTVRMHPTDSLKRPGCRREGRHQLQCDLQTQVGRMSRRWQVV
jgi:hypothetical protein